jgi:hypothetical protein
MKNNSSDPSLTSSYAPPKNAKKIPKGDKGFSMVKKAMDKGLSEKKVKDFESWSYSENEKNSRK